MLNKAESLELQRLQDELPEVSTAAVKCLSGPLTTVALRQYRELEARIKAIIARIKAIAG